MPKTVVLGSANQDIVTTTARYPSLGETVMGTSLNYLPGGKGLNQTVAAALTGAQSIFIGAVGNDAAGAQLIAFLESHSIDVAHVKRVDAPTGTAIITVDSNGDNSIVVIPAANETVVDGQTVPLHNDVLLAQFEVPKSSVLEFFRRGRANNCTTILNPSPISGISRELLQLIDILVVNEHEASQIQNYRGTSVITLGAKGVAVNGSLGTFELPGHEVKAKDTTGAGDCFAGSLAGELSKGSTFSDAVAYANKAAAMCVTREGAAPSMFSHAEITSA